MSGLIQVRNVPDGVHRTLKSRAALAGRSLSDYLLEELTRFARSPTRADLLKRLPRHDDVLNPSPADVIREARDRG